tara:strand:+ start:448 stop:1335 length:888 start_codon:yes stop_codon:yes gene_type:complete
MSKKHPIVAVTGSSGAGTTSVRNTFEDIFSLQGISASIVEGDSFHKYNREEMRKLVDEWERTAGRGISHFGPEANLFKELEALFKNYGKRGEGVSRIYLHNEDRASQHRQKPGTFTTWQNIPKNSDLMFYEGLHGGMVDKNIDIASNVDLLIGVTPTINLEWIQKINRDINSRGHSIEAITNTILRRMDDYVNYIVPQFSRTHINFQRVPIVDTSNPFDYFKIPEEEESLLVIKFNQRINTVEYQDIIAKIPAFMSRQDTIVIPGTRGSDAMKILLAPRIKTLVEVGRILRKKSS